MNASSVRYRGCFCTTPLLERSKRRCLRSSLSLSLSLSFSLLLPSLSPLSFEHVKHAFVRVQPLPQCTYTHHYSGNQVFIRTRIVPPRPIFRHRLYCTVTGVSRRSFSLVLVQMVYNALSNLHSFRRCARTFLFNQCFDIAVSRTPPTPPHFRVPQRVKCILSRGDSQSSRRLIPSSLISKSKLANFSPATRFVRFLSPILRFSKEYSACFRA